MKGTKKVIESILNGKSVRKAISESVDLIPMSDSDISYLKSQFRGEDIKIDKGYDGTVVGIWMKDFKGIDGFEVAISTDTDGGYYISADINQEFAGDDTIGYKSLTTLDNIKKVVDDVTSKVVDAYNEMYN